MTSVLIGIINHVFFKFIYLFVIEFNMNCTVYIIFDKLINLFIPEV